MTQNAENGQVLRKAQDGGGGLMAQFSVHYFVLFAMMAAVYPYFQLFLRARGFTKPQIGYLQGFMALAGIFGPMALGYVADRTGQRRAVLSFSLIAFALLLVPLNVTKGFFVAALLAAGAGLTVRAPVPLTDALTAGELADPVHEYGRVRVWGSIGFVITLLAIRLLRLVDEASSTSMAVAMLATTGLCLVSSLMLPEGHASRRPSEGSDDRRRGFDAVFWLFVVAAGLHQFGMTAYYSFFTIYLHDTLGMENAAWVWAIAGVAELPLLFHAGKIINRFGLANMLIASMAAVTVRLGVIGLVPALWAVLPSQLLHAMTFALFHVASIEFLRRKVHSARRGLAMAVYISVAGAFPSWIGSSLGGIIAERLGYATLYLTYAAVPLVAIFLLAPAKERIEAAT